MRLTLHGTRVLKLQVLQHGLPEDEGDAVFVPRLEEGVNSENEYELTFNFAQMEGEDDGYAIIFSFSTVLPSQSLRLELDYIAEFKSDQPLPEGFHDSHFANVNSPAIAFPYLRAFISNLLVSSGYNPLILPSINFQAWGKEK